MVCPGKACLKEEVVLVQIRELARVVLVVHPRGTLNLELVQKGHPQLRLKR